MNGSLLLPEFCQETAIKTMPGRDGAQSGESTAATPLRSPSLSASERSVPAYEMKFLLRLEQAARVERWAQQYLALDPNTESALGNAYRVQSVYLDTER